MKIYVSAPAFTESVYDIGLLTLDAQSNIQLLESAVDMMVAV